MVEFWLNICKIRPPAADNLDDKSIVSEKAAQIYPDLLEPQPGLWLADKNGEKATVRVSLNIDKNKKGAYRINLSVHNTADNDYPIYQSYW